MAQTVTVTGVDDLVDDGDVAYTIVTAPATSTDPTTAASTPPTSRSTNTDNDTAGITVDADVRPDDDRSRRDGDLHGRARHRSRRADVTIALSSSDPTEGTVVRRA